MYKVTVSHNLSRKLYAVYLLNVIDWLCTVYLLSTGLFYEANPISDMFIGNIALGFMFKCAVPFVLVFFVSRFMSILDIAQLKTADMLISFGLTVYIAITIDHIINFIILLT